MNISIIIPCFNGGEMLSKNLPILYSYIDNNKNNSFDIYVINDGSTDNTLHILKNQNRIALLSYDKNKGKGGAINYGIKHLQPCDAVLYMDCDFSTKIDCLNAFIDELKRYDVIIGSRFHKESKLPLKRTLKRKIVSKCCNIFVNRLFRFNIKDTQCGFKLFKYDVINKFAKKQTINDWSFDIEYLYMAKLNNLKIIEMPVEWVENYDSSIKIISASNGFIKNAFKVKKQKKSYLFNEH